MSHLERPVVSPDGEIIVTLSDARAYVLKLPQDRQNDPIVQAGVAAIMMAAEGRALMLLAQSGVAHIVHGPVKPLGRTKPYPPWMKRKAKQ